MDEEVMSQGYSATEMGDEAEIDESDKEDEEDRMDTGVMQISGITFKNEDQNRLDNVSQKVHKRWNDDMNRMREDMKQYGSEVKFHITEVYSPPRVNTMAERLGLIPGMSLDLTTVDPDDGMPWDFNNEDKARKAEDMVRSKRAVLLIGSPMCAAFSTLQVMNFCRMSRVRKRLTG